MASLFHDEECESCGQSLRFCDCELERAVEGELEDEERRCGCRYCHCFERTEYGEPCRMCADGAHQG
jgi:hypothetical protein